MEVSNKQRDLSVANVGRFAGQFQGGCSAISHRCARVLCRGLPVDVCHDTPVLPRISWRMDLLRTVRIRLTTQESTTPPRFSSQLSPSLPLQARKPACANQQFLTAGQFF